MVRIKSQEEKPKVASNNPFLALASSIPAPFPREQLLQVQGVEAEAVQKEPTTEQPSQAEAGPSHVSEPFENTTTATLHELLPSIAQVERTCIMVLNNLVSAPERWAPIVPDRRHSMPSTPVASKETIDSSALQILVSNLRNRDAGDTMFEIRQGESDSDLINEVRTRIEGMSLEPDDAQLAQTLLSLLSHFHRLSAIPTTTRPRLTPSSTWTADMTTSGDLFSTLKRQVSDFQLEMLSSQAEKPSRPVDAVESALLWSRIDEELEQIVTMCKERTERHLPPQYDLADYDVDPLPEYEPGVRTSLDGTKSKPPRSPTIANASLNEKMRLDLESVTMAIDRLYMVAPQLHNQRVELKSTKLEQMEKARALGASPKGKQKERDEGELEHIIRLIGKASERSLRDQSVILEGGMKARLEKARQRDVAKKAAFVEQLAQHSDAGRFHDQDAELHPRIKDPEALLSLPEFIRESVPPESIRKDPYAMLTLPEFVKEPPPTHLVPTFTPHPIPSISRIKSKNRSRSMSAPSMSWFRPSSRSGHQSPNNKSTQVSPRPSESGSRTGFEVQYIAENHETLQHVLVFVSVQGATAGVDIEAEVLPPLSDETLAGGDRLVIRSGANVSLPLILPGRVLAGKKEIRVQSEHYELKLSSLSPLLPSVMPSVPMPLLDAEQLSRDNPTSFICASCSLPLVQSSKVNHYKDLPSEHWQELVDAWMCHSDQKLHDHVAKHSRGFWPEPRQALVGGSYILFPEDAMVKDNLCPAAQIKSGEDWRLVRCLCGAIVGRCQEHRSSDGASSNVYRFLKFAIRPVSQTAEPVKVPLSAFIVEDMKEFVHAHASYRFVIQDEEDERPRILIWLFKPSMQIAYSTQTPYALPKSGCINAAKVLYKLIGPSEVSTDLTTLLDKYPGFPQAEYLFYPMDICRQLAALLRESNRTYPESLRVLTGLDVGWLRRA